jgi:hypothetical protein
MDNGNNGLKNQFGVGEPITPGHKAAGPDKQAKEFQAAFQKEQTAINGHLQFTAVNADTARHAALAARRDALYPAFQAALAKIDPKDTSKAKADIDKVLADARTLGAEVSALRQQAQKAKTDWDARQAKYDAAVHQVEELEAGQDAKAPALRALVDGIRKQVNQRQYALAASTLDPLLPKLEPIHQAHLQQKEAKAKVEPLLAELTARLGTLKTANRPSKPMTAKAGEATAALQAAQSKASAKDFLAAGELLKSLRAAIDVLEKLAKDPERAKFLSSGPAPELVCKPQPEPAFKSLDAEWLAIEQAREKTQSLADAGDYAGANKLQADFKLKLEAFKAKQAELAPQKQTFEKLRLLVEPRISAAAKKQYLNLTKQLEEIKKLQGQATAAAQADHYAQATQHMKEASTKTDAYVTASDKEVEPPIMGESQGTRADATLKKLPEADQKAVKVLMDATKSEAEKQYLLKGVAAGHTVAELKAFAKKVQGKDATWMRDNLSLTGSSTGSGVRQQWSHSCNATAAQAVKGQMDPLYALKLHEENPNLDQADAKDGTKMNPKLAAEQKAGLESKYKGSVVAAKDSKGAAKPISSTKGVGRWADDLLNNQSDTTGITYSTQQDPPIADAMKSIDSGVGKGQPVPIVIGNSPGEYGHYVVVTGMTKGPPKQYTIHDPGSGKTVVRSEVEMSGGNLKISGWSQITAIENPSAKAIK